MTISYLRKSPGGNKKDLERGLSIDAQRSAATTYSPTKEYIEIESGRNNSRPQLKLALDECRTLGATLIVAKVDRLGRHAAYLLNLIDTSGVDFIFCDMPNANKLTIGIMALIAQDEAERISLRTKAALAEKKKRITEDGGFLNKHGILVKSLGKNNLTLEARINGAESRKEAAKNNENNIRAKAIISSIEGTLKEKADYLNGNGFRTSKGKLFSPIQIQRLK